ncbi:2-dehydro-3-deoxygalactonokinase [Agaribacterium haliotis]|uniref:2-dehydro-3-deoxygalactonokinase n=1 Tax=Agaribacterium haliotis TaxID=2013869 RepID=UPI000BB58E0F|nr:2-dehydro-3-deoxygalactonokinase [Agaribacterium haliotis]
MPSEQPDRLIVDWGTSNFRAFAVNDAGRVLNDIELELGLLKVENGAFAEALQGSLHTWLGAHYQHLPVYMAGMVGSAKGWVNVQYVDTAAGCSELAQKAHCFQLPWGPEARIMPGVRHKQQSDIYDVMRGEEVQLLGLDELCQSREFHAILPGTHSKHAHIRGNKIQTFSSYLSGELFAVISQHMLLGKGLELSELGQHNSAFFKGLDDGLATEQLSNCLFRTWTHRLFKQLDEKTAPDYLSGMLIGNELKTAKAKHYYIVGSSKLSQRYQLACKHRGLDSDIINGNDCFLAGMQRLIKESQS